MKSIKLIVAYPQPKDASAFEKVYQQEHVPLAIANLPGKTKMVATKILQSPTSSTQPMCCVLSSMPWRALTALSASRSHHFLRWIRNAALPRRGVCGAQSIAGT